MQSLPAVVRFDFRPAARPNERRFPNGFREAKAATAVWQFRLQTHDTREMAIVGSVRAFVDCEMAKPSPPRERGSVTTGTQMSVQAQARTPPGIEMSVQSHPRQGSEEAIARARVSMQPAFWPLNSCKMATCTIPLNDLVHYMPFTPLNTTIAMHIGIVLNPKRSRAMYIRTVLNPKRSYRHGCEVSFQDVGPHAGVRSRASSSGSCSSRLNRGPRRLRLCFSPACTNCFLTVTFRSPRLRLLHIKSVNSKTVYDCSDDDDNVLSSPKKAKPSLLTLRVEWVDGIGICNSWNL